MTAATVFYVAADGVMTILENQTVPQVQEIRQNYKYFGTVNRAITAEEKTKLSTYLAQI